MDKTVLLLGDIVGRAGRRAVREILPDLKEELAVDFVIANGENAAGGFGLTEKVTDELFAYGIDLLTSGNHIWDKKEIYDFIEDNDLILRPYNFPQPAPGVGMKIIEKGDFQLGIINLLGRVFMKNLDCPFKAFDKGYQKLLEKGADAIIVDFHAEATAEKQALGYYAAQRASVVFGTHTHVQTADEKILQDYTAYITDLGFSGAVNSVLGMKPEEPIERFLTGRPNRFKVGTGKVQLAALLVTLDKFGKTLALKRIKREYST